MQTVQEPMSYDSDISPVDWYIATYQLRFIELAQAGNEDLDCRFLTWENTILVNATSIEVAYDKAVVFGLANTVPYKGGVDAVDVQWVFEGIVQLLPIYEDLNDGSEISWAESTRALKTIRRRVMSKDEVRKNPKRRQQLG